MAWYMGNIASHGAQLGKVATKASSISIHVSAEENRRVICMQYSV